MYYFQKYSYRVDTWEEGTVRSNRSSKLEEYKPVDGIDDRFRPSVDRDGENLKILFLFQSAISYLCKSIVKLFFKI